MHVNPAALRARPPREGEPRQRRRVAPVAAPVLLAKHRRNRRHASKVPADAAPAERADAAVAPDQLAPDPAPPALQLVPVRVQLELPADPLQTPGAHRAAQLRVRQARQPLLARLATGGAVAPGPSRRRWRWWELRRLGRFVWPVPVLGCELVLFLLGRGLVDLGQPGGRVLRRGLQVDRQWSDDETAAAAAAAAAAAYRPHTVR